MTPLCLANIYKCQYENDWFFGVANFVSIENKDVNVKFMHSKGQSTNFFKPNKDDMCWVPISNILGCVNLPKASLTGHFYNFHDVSNRFYIFFKKKFHIFFGFWWLPEDFLLQLRRNRKKVLPKFKIYVQSSHSSFNIL